MMKMPVSILQELMVEKKLTLPNYDYQDEGLPHCKTFTCVVTAGEQTARGVGKTKKDAKQDAAKNILKFFEINLPNVNEQTSDSEQSIQTAQICLLPTKSNKTELVINYIGKLNEFCSGNQLPQPLYTDQVLVSGAQFCIICSLLNFKTEGFGFNKKEAKQQSAQKMLVMVKENNIGFDNTLNNKEKIIALENNEAVDKILKKYTFLMQELTLSEKGKKDDVNNNEELLEQISADITTWVELKCILDALGYKYQLKKFQNSPLIMSLRINDSVIMFNGDTEEEAVEKLVFRAAEMIKYGMNFKLFEP